MREIKTLVFCPVCNQKHGREDLKLISDNKESALVYVSCKKCKNSSLAIFTKQGMEKIVTMGIMTDLNYEEVCEISKRQPINSDEVLEVYKILKDKK